MERKWLILTSVSLGSLMSTLDGSIVNIACRRCRRFRIDLTTVEWVVVAYLLVVGSLLLPFGRLGEVLTFKRVYLVASRSSRWRGPVRAFRALGAGSFSRRPGCGRGDAHGDGPAIVAHTFHDRERGRALGLTASASR